MILKKINLQHVWAFLAATICGVILFLPQWWLIRDTGPAYSGIPIAEVDNDHYYLDRIAAAYHGNWKLNQVVITGTEDLPYTSPPLAENTVAELAKIFFIQPMQMQVAGYFLFPFILALIFYLLAWRLTESRVVAFLTPLAIILTSSIAMSPGNLIALFKPPSELWTIVYNRPVHPQISSIYFYGWLSLFFSFYLRPTKLKLILSGSLLGLLFYIYPYSWTLAATLSVVLLAVSIVKKDWVMVRQFLIMGLIGLLVSSFYWLNVYTLSGSGLLELAKQRFVIFRSHNFLWSNLLFIDVVFLAVIFWRKPKDQKFIFTAALIGTFWVVINQQIITGVRMFPGHWHWYYIVPMTVFLSVWLGWTVVSSRKILQGVFIAVLTVFFLIFGYVSQQQYYLKFKDLAVSLQPYRQVYEWLAINSKPGQTVLAGDRFSEDLPMFAPLYYYTWQGADELYLISNDRIKHGLFVKLRLQGVGENNLDKYINTRTPELRIILGGYFKNVSENCTDCYDLSDIELIRSEYRQFLKQDFKQELKKYPVDYAVWDPKGQFVDFNEFGFMQQVAEVNGFKVYKVK